MKGIVDTIVIIEDDKVVAGLMKKSLQSRFNVEVLSFHSGEEYFESAHQQPDIIILDYQLNEDQEDAMNGLEISQKIEGIPYIMMSGQKDLDTAVALIHNGAVDYIVKDAKLYSNMNKSIQAIIDTLTANAEINELVKTSKKDALRIWILLAILLLAIWVSYMLST